MFYAAGSLGMRQDGNNASDRRIRAAFHRQHIHANSLVSSPEKGIHLPPESRRIGVVFQDYAVWPHRTVFENVIYPLAIQKVSKAEGVARANEAISNVNLTGLEKRFPYQLSGGQQQRVALARALVSKPEIMLLDEPLCNLDANLREEMRFEIKELQRTTGVTILYVTHDQEIALAISDRMAIMDRSGRIRQVGEPEAVFEEPADSYVFQFMGLSNFIPVEIRNGEIIASGSGEMIDYPLGEISHARPKGGRLVAAFRPGDAELTRNGTRTRGIVTRKTFLGHVIDYRINVGGHEIRVQHDTGTSIEANLLFEESETCGIMFRTLRLYDSESIEEHIVA